ncbi:Aminopeptidase N [Ooceraea biroi]|uniref:Aminopeptidase N n=1 Tax=Ooceraea biroi TaxID=2015173 RepID=A0A026VY27_OOCBI|nr:Aminopeptidase N [Ooceraea biroi]
MCAICVRKLLYIIYCSLTIRNYTFCTFSKFQSPSLNHLWDLMQNNMDNSNLKNYTLKNIMETWITRNNHPVVHVHRSENLLSISENYVDDKGALAGPASPNCLPITFTTWKQLDFNNTVPYNWILPEESSEVHVPLSDSDGWIIVNLKQTGEYRVHQINKIPVYFTA